MNEKQRTMNDDVTLAGPGAERRAELVPGLRLGRYGIVRLLGRGGMGQVYLARHELQKTLHALKILPAEFSGRAGFVERFRTELQTMARLQHPNIVHVTHSDEENGRYYLVMDFVAADGTEEPYDLEEALAVEGRLAPETVRRLMLQLCDGLSFAHGQGVVHRDLKPANVLLTSKDLSAADVKLCDFGLARVIGEEQIRTLVSQSMQRSLSMGDRDTCTEKRRSERSSTGAVLGTYGYMSPEQEEGKSADERSDLYALGVMMYRMITGQRLRGRAKAALAVVPGLHKSWDAIIDRCLETDPAERWQSVGELKRALAGVGGLRTKVRGRRAAGRWGTAAAVAVVLAYGTYTTCRTYGTNRERGRVADEQAAKADIEQQRLAADRIRTVKGPVAGETWASPATGMEFVWVPTLKLWVGKYEVTNGEYRKKEPGHDSKEYKEYSLNDDRQPVVYVNFDDAKAYAEWLTGQDLERLGGLRYRVVSEAEWQTVAQCGDGREYPWGNAMPPKHGNYSDSASPLEGKIAGYTDGFAVACPVELSGANEWGVYGLGGNVWECCASDASGSAFGAWRGASWNDHYPVALRCAVRYDSDGSDRDDYGGFRLSLSR